MKRRMAWRDFIILEVHMEKNSALQPTWEAICFCTPFAGSRPNKKTANFDGKDNYASLSGRPWPRRSNVRERLALVNRVAKQPSKPLATTAKRQQPQNGRKLGAEKQREQEHGILSKGQL